MSVADKFLGFNSRTREGATQRRVSIHAPVRVRLNAALLLAAVNRFNSRTREGATPFSVRPVAEPCGFNSRTREGATKNQQNCYQVSSCFNSRTREGATQVHKLNELSNPVSIHAPVRVRHNKTVMSWVCISFNSRTREGATRISQRFTLHK